MDSSVASPQRARVRPSPQLVASHAPAARHVFLHEGRHLRAIAEDALLFAEWADVYRVH